MHNSTASESSVDFSQRFAWLSDEWKWIDIVVFTGLALCQRFQRKSTLQNCSSTIGLFQWSLQKIRNNGVNKKMGTSIPMLWILSRATRRSCNAAAKMLFSQKVAVRLPRSGFPGNSPRSIVGRPHQANAGDSSWTAENKRRSVPFWTLALKVQQCYALPKPPLRICAGRPEPGIVVEILFHCSCRYSNTK